MFELSVTSTTMVLFDLRFYSQGTKRAFVEQFARNDDGTTKTTTAKDRASRKNESEQTSWLVHDLQSFAVRTATALLCDLTK